MKTDSNEKKISSNALTNEILLQYFQHFKWIEMSGLICINPELMVGLISCCSKDVIQSLGKKLGTIDTKNQFYSMGVEVTYDSLMNYIENNLGHLSKWFNFSYHSNKNKQVIHLTHRLGLNWSIFLSQFIGSMFEFFLKKTTRNDCQDNYVSIEYVL